MADFPTNPVNGDTHVIASSTWEYYLSTDRWEIQDTSGVPQTVSTLLQTITWSAGDNNVQSNPIIYSNYASLIITYVNVLGNTSNSSFKMCKPHQVVGQLDCINPRTYVDGEGIMTMNGTQTINASSGTSSSVINLNGTEVLTSHSNTIGADYDPITFGWTTGAFAAGGSIEIRGISLQIQPNSLESLSNVHTTVPTDGQVLTWDNTNSYWKPDASGGGGSSLTIGSVPAAPAIGNMWFDDTTTGFLYTWDSNSWIQMTGLGGGSSSSSIAPVEPDFASPTFTSLTSGSWTNTATADQTVWFYLVAGGAGGGHANSQHTSVHGGGGGSIVFGTKGSYIDSTVTFTIGAGGAGNNHHVTGSGGDSSMIISSTNTMTANGAVGMYMSGGSAMPSTSGASSISFEPDFVGSTTVDQLSITQPSAFTIAATTGIIFYPRAGAMSASVSTWAGDGGVGVNGGSGSTAGTVPGGGGGGNIDNDTGGSGANGAAGSIRIYVI